MRNAMHFVISLVWVVALVADVGRAEDKATDAKAALEEAKWLSGFVDNQAISIVAVDLRRLDPNGAQEWVGGIVRRAETDPAKQKEMTEELAVGFEFIRGRVEGWKAAGLTRFYTVLRSERLGEELQGLVLVPLQQGADVAALKKVMAEDAPPNMTESAEFKGALVMGDRASLDAARNAPGADAQILGEALSASGSAAVRLVILPTRAWTQVAAIAGGLVPNDVADVAAIAGSVRWVSLSVDAPPKASATLTVACTDAPKANELARTTERLLAMLKADKEFQGTLVNAERVVGMMLPEAREDRVIIALTNDEVEQFAKDELPGLIRRARAQAAVIESLSNERQLFTGMIMYANEHKGAWPNDLKGVVDQYLKEPKVLRSPRQPQREAGYVYVKPKAPFGQVRRPDSLLVIYEAFDEWKEGDGVCVGFADGHCERVLEKARFDEMLRLAKQAQ
jgi:hypothetical protein